MNRPTNTDLGVTLINNIYDDMKIDAKWTVWEPRGFTWWGWGSAQRVWSEPAVNDDGFVLYRLHARSEFFDGFENTDQQAMVLSLLGMHATLSGAVRAPERPGGIDLAASVYAHEENLNWTRPLFSIAVAMQAAEAAIFVGQAIDLEAGLRPALSAHPESGPRAEMDEMLEIIKNLVNPEGRGPSRYNGPEMNQLLATFQQPPCVMAAGDESGLAAEYPYPGNTSLVRLSTTERNPRAGSGLLALLTIPKGRSDPATARQALDWNEKELRSFTRTHFLGSWCMSDTGLSHATFYPNCIHREGCLMNIAMTDIVRLQWLTEDILDYNMQKQFEETFSAKRMLLGLDSPSEQRKQTGAPTSGLEPTPEGVQRTGRTRRDDVMAHPLLRIARLKYSEGTIEQKLILRFLNARVIPEVMTHQQHHVQADSTMMTWVKDARRWAEGMLQTELQVISAMLEEEGEEPVEGARQVFRRLLGAQPGQSNDLEVTDALMAWAKRRGFDGEKNPAHLWELVVEVVDAALWLGWLFPRSDDSRQHHPTV